MSKDLAEIEQKAADDIKQIKVAAWRRQRGYLRAREAKFRSVLQNNNSNYSAVSNLLVSLFSRGVK